MKLLFLGTGTSNGIPEVACRCEVCTSLDPNDKRMRASAIVEDDGRRLLIDCGPDVRTQLLRAGSPPIDALLVTHSHFDHVGGLIDIRPYCGDRNFPIYCNAKSEQEIKQFFPYCFVEHLYPGVPTFDFHEIKPFEPFTVAGFEVLPLPVMHAQLEILGYKIGKHLAYITDCKVMPDSTIEALKGIDTLVINALRYKPHHSHMSVDECLETIRRIGPRRAYITHISHRLGRAAEVELPHGVHLANDFMQLDIE